MSNITDYRFGIELTSNGSDFSGWSAHVLKTATTFSTDGSDLLRLSNNGTAVMNFSWQGGIDHANSGASTAAHSQSLNLNWASSGSDTSSGQYSVVIGANNLASGARAFAQGYYNDVTGIGSWAFGGYNTVEGDYSGAFGNNNFVSVSYSCAFGKDSKTITGSTITLGNDAWVNRADSQSMWITVNAATTSATQSTMLAAGSTNLLIEADSSWVFSAMIIARSDEADGNDSAAYLLEGCIARDESNNTALVGSVTKTVIAESAGATTWDVTAEADDTNEALAIKVTGEASTNIRWTARVDIAQVRYV